jgi:hypothetical protein
MDVPKGELMQLKKVLSLSLGLVVLATLGVLIDTATVGASPRLNPVLAATTASIPVAVTNTPLPVTGTVNVGTLPAVQLAGTPAVTATLSNSSFTVANSVGNPVPVYDVNEAGDNPYFAFGCNSPSGAGGCPVSNSSILLPTVNNSNQPIKQVVLDFVSGSCFTIPGGEISDVHLNVNNPSAGQNSAVFVPINTHSNAAQIFYAYSQQTRIYAQPGATLAIGFSYDTLSGPTPPPAECSMYFNGHFVMQ